MVIPDNSWHGPECFEHVQNTRGRGPEFQYEVHSGLARSLLGARSRAHSGSLGVFGSHSEYSGRARVYKICLELSVCAPSAPSSPRSCPVYPRVFTRGSVWSRSLYSECTREIRGVLADRSGFARFELRVLGVQLGVSTSYTRGTPSTPLLHPGRTRAKLGLLSFQASSGLF